MTTYYPSRFAPKPVAPSTGAPARRGRTLAEALTDPAAVLRVHVVWDRADRPRWVVEAWTARYAPVPLDNAAQQQLLTWLHETHPAVNLWRPHQFDLRTGQVGTAPYVEDDGGIPELDLSYGTHRAPVLVDSTTTPLPFAASTAERRAA